MAVPRTEKVTASPSLSVPTVLLRFTVPTRRVVAQTTWWLDLPTTDRMTTGPQVTMAYRLLWETTNTRDENIGAAMRAIFEQVEETSRHVALRETGEKLDALLKVVGLPHEDSIAKPSAPTPAFPIPGSPTPASPIPRPTTPKLLPPLELSSPRADSTRIPMFPQDADIIEVDESPKSNKRSGSIVTPGESKRRKVGVS
ncbi:hypothetical protein BYT27DRAFT_7216285 [Phlegmacium glaucopus]|nr:hypothetical protein BYT27DRAFT_7216285 [Phlegmacium glaucopus]